MSALMASVLTEEIMSFNTKCDIKEQMRIRTFSLDGLYFNVYTVKNIMSTFFQFYGYINLVFAPLSYYFL